MATHKVSAASRYGIEWPTLALVGGVYFLLALIVGYHALLPWWFILPTGAYLATLHSSLQHEALHGHPTRSRALNEWLVTISPTFWMPYGCYRDTHLQHHNDLHLTDPVHDPESYYLLPDEWATSGALKRVLFTINQTLAGRMLIGPAVGTCRFWWQEARAVTAGNTQNLSCWIKFFCVSALTIYVITGVAGMPFWQYYLLVAYPGISMALVRSYCEHQAAEDLGERTIIVEASLFWSLLFLNNNLHIAHHARPALPWYELPAYYRAERAALIKKNNGYLMQGYGEIFRQYFLKPKESIAYPNLDWLRH